jgi:DNA (cytosine-5)-methyltransferase 1
MITIGSLFSGIGGFEAGLERAIQNSKTIWQVEQNKYCQGILKKHWPEAIMYNDIREINHENIHPVDIICGGFPCQDISAAGKGAGIEHGTRSSLWGEMYRLINELRPRVAVMENVPALLWKGRGMHVVMSNLAQIGYNAEWTVISARQFGAPHLRKRVFIVAYPNSQRRDSRKHHERQYKNNLDQERNSQKNIKQRCKRISRTSAICETTTDPNSQHIKKQSMYTEPMESKRLFECGRGENGRIHERNYWKTTPTKSPICRVDDGIPRRVDRIKALGNAIVPQCSEYIGRCIWESGLLD